MRGEFAAFCPEARAAYIVQRMETGDAAPHRRRPRYGGKNPRRFEEKYKELNPERYSDTVAKVLAAGKTPAGSHRPIMVAEVLQVLSPQAGEVAVDCTLGHGGHACEILQHILPGGRLLGLDADPIELPKTEARLRALGFEGQQFTAHRSNFAGLSRVLAAAGSAVPMLSWRILAFRRCSWTSPHAASR
jgi:16S rRNA (cytosine1402-N4)-methyltransferase